MPDDILSIFDRDQRIEAISLDATREETPYVVRHISHESQNPESWIVYSNLDSVNADAVIAGEIAYFEALGHAFEWKYYTHDQPPDLKDRLAAHGFNIEEEETVMVLDVAHLPDALKQPSSHDIRQITDPAEVDNVLNVQRAVWQTDYTDFGRRMANELKNHPDNLRIFAAYVDDKPVSSAWMSLTPNSLFAGLWGGSTLPQYRKRGIYTALVAIRALEALKQKRQFINIDAGPMSRPILEKLGFKAITHTYPCKWVIKK